MIEIKKLTTERKIAVLEHARVKYEYAYFTRKDYNYLRRNKMEQGLCRFLNRNYYITDPTITRPLGHAILQGFTRPDKFISPTPTHAIDALDYHRLEPYLLKTLIPRINLINRMLFRLKKI